MLLKSITIKYYNITKIKLYRNHIPVWFYCLSHIEEQTVGVD